MEFYLDIDHKRIGLGIRISEFLKEFEKAEIIHSKDKIIIYTFQKNILNLPFQSNSEFSFADEHLIGVTIGPSQEYLNSMNYSVQDSFKIYNEALIENYGKPNKIKRLFSKTYIWRFDDAILEHYLFNRFGIQEVLSIRRK